MAPGNYKAVDKGQNLGDFKDKLKSAAHGAIHGDKKEGEDDEENEGPNIEKAREHWIQNSCTRDGNYLPILTSSIADIRKFSIGIGLYFELSFFLIKVWTVVCIVLFPTWTLTMGGSRFDDWARSGQLREDEITAVIDMFSAGSIVNANLGGKLSDSLEGNIIGLGPHDYENAGRWIGGLDALVCIIILVACYKYKNTVDQLSSSSKTDRFYVEDYAVLVTCLPRRMPKQHQYEYCLQHHFETLIREDLLEEDDVARIELKGELLVSEVAIVRDFKCELEPIITEAKKCRTQKERIAGSKAEGEKRQKELKTLDELEKAQKMLGQRMHIEQRDCVQAYITFNKARHRDAILTRYRFSHSSVLRSFMPKRLRFAGKAIEVSPPQNPGNILWFNLDFPPRQRQKRIAIVYTGVSCLLVASVYTVLVVNAQKAALGGEKCEVFWNMTQPFEFNAKPDCTTDTFQAPETCPMPHCVWGYPVTTTAAPKSANANSYTVSVQVVRNEIACRESGKVAENPDEIACWCSRLGWWTVKDDEKLTDFCWVYVEQQMEKLSLTGFASGLVATVNVALMFIFGVLASYVKPHSIAERELSVSNGVFFVQTLNIGIVALVVNGNLPIKLGEFIGNGNYDDFTVGWYGKVMGAQFMALLTIIFSTPAAWLGQTLVFGRLREWQAPKQTSHTDLLDWYTPPPFPIARSHALQIMYLTVSMMYSAGSPLCYLFFLFYLCFTFMFEKYMFLRHAQRPPAYDDGLLKNSLGIVPKAICVHCALGFWMLSCQEVVPGGESVGVFSSLGNKDGDVMSQAFYRGGLPAAMPLFYVLMFSLLWYGLKVLAWILGCAGGDLIKSLSGLSFEASTELGNHYASSFGVAQKQLKDEHEPYSYRYETFPQFKDIAEHFTKLGDTIKTTEHVKRIMIGNRVYHHHKSGKQDKQRIAATQTKAPLKIPPCTMCGAKLNPHNKLNLACLTECPDDEVIIYNNSKEEKVVKPMSSALDKAMDDDDIPDEGERGASGQNGQAKKKGARKGKGKAAPQSAGDKYGMYENDDDDNDFSSDEDDDEKRPLKEAGAASPVKAAPAKVNPYEDDVEDDDEVADLPTKSGASAASIPSETSIGGFGATGSRASTASASAATDKMGKMKSDRTAKGKAKSKAKSKAKAKS